MIVPFFYASPGGRNESYLEGVLLVFVPVLRNKEGSNKPTPRERLHRQIFGQLCIMPLMLMYGGDPLAGRKPHVASKLHYVKLTALYLRASDGGD